MRIIFCETAPAPVGPYSQACAGCDLLFISGQIGTEPVTGEMSDSLDKQVLQALENVKAILWTAGLGVEHLIMVNVYLTDLDLFEKFNDIYAGFLGEHRPCRAVVEVSRLPKGAKVEISSIAVIPAK